jgi:hypothetical protein
VDNPSLSKGTINLNIFKINLGVHPIFFPCEPQISWIQVPTETRYDLGPTCQIPSNFEAPKSLELKIDRI